MLIAFGQYLTLLLVFISLLFIYYLQRKLVCKDLPFGPLLPVTIASGAGLHPDYLTLCVLSSD